MFGISRFDDLPANCGVAEWPGIDELPKWQNFSERETTKGQKRVENVIAREQLAVGGALLHVGVGNSQLAVRFSGHFDFIAGITIQDGELRKAMSLGITNYDPRLFNKFDGGLANLFGGPFDLILDNNPTSFGCCIGHFIAMMENYRQVLKPSGFLLADRDGLACWTSLADPRWGVTVEEWRSIGIAFGFSWREYGTDVIALQAPCPA